MKFLRNPDGYPSLPQSSTSAQTKLYLGGSEGRALLGEGCRIGEERARLDNISLRPVLPSSLYLYRK